MTSKQRSYLKGLAMTMDPILQIGKSSLTPELTQAVDEALEARELIKIHVLKNCLDDAKELGHLLGGMLCHVNLIPVNPIKEKNFKRSEKNAIKVFTETLETYKINVTVRRKLGADINASCGQLRAEETNN